MTFGEREAAEHGVCPHGGTARVFVSLDDFPIREMGDVVIVIGGKKPDETVKAILRRDGAEMTFTPVLTVPPETPAKQPAKP